MSRFYSQDILHKRSCINELAPNNDYTFKLRSAFHTIIVNKKFRREANLTHFFEVLSFLYIHQFIYYFRTE